MANVNININEAAVTAVHEFRSVRGYGVDFYIEAQSSDCTVYLQVVTYDNEARSYCQYIHEGDYVRVTGDLKVKVYKKKDGTEGTALIIERPVSFSKLVRDNSKPQLLHGTPDSKIQKSIQTTTAVTAKAVPADAVIDGDGFWDIVFSDAEKKSVAEADDEYENDMPF